MRVRCAGQREREPHAVPQEDTGEVKELALERYRSVHLTDVDNWLDTYAPEIDDDCLELIEATPNERRALRRAGFNIKRAA